MRERKGEVMQNKSRDRKRAEGKIKAKGERR
jgi:hypothetical protein